MSTILLTGFPGFLGSELLPRILTRSPSGRAVCLVQGRFAELAAARRQEIAARWPELEGRIELVEGDITVPDLALDRARELQREITEVYHLAAVYDLGVRREIGLRVNLDGTRHVLAFAERCDGLESFQYVSTCYVSGRYAGIFSEDDLEKGQKFNNYYEETKYLAEVEVRKARSEGLPVTVYRPAIVVGDSRTGATQKYDGPYFIIRWVLRQALVAVVPVVGDPTAVRVNLVPRDFVVDAIARLSAHTRSRGKVYQLADPSPLTVDEILREVGHATGRIIVRLPVMRGPAKAAIDFLPGVYRMMQIPAPAVDYFVHPTHYTCANTLADLEGSGIRVPPFPSYLDRLVEFVRKHPEIGSEAMV